MKSGSGNPNWKGGKTTLTCFVCLNTFEVIYCRAKKAKCCSLTCWNLFQKNGGAIGNYKGGCGIKGPRVERQTKACQWCGSLMQLTPSGMERKLYCSKQCGILGRSKKTTGEGNPNYRHGGKRECILCGKHFISRSMAKYCSLKCARKLRVGPLAPCWKGGRLSAIMVIRNSQEYKQWRSAVFIRDKYTCQECGSKGGRLSAHHIKKFSENESVRFFVPNGITLCWPCHKNVNWKEKENASRLSMKIKQLL